MTGELLIVVPLTTRLRGGTRKVADHPIIYRVETDPYFGRSQDVIDWQSPRAGNRLGPFAAPHLSSIGVAATSIGSGFVRDAPAKMIYKHNPRRPMRDFEGVGFSYWIVSDKTKVLLEEYARNSIDFAVVEVVFRERTEDRSAGSRWLCDVIRFEDAVDEKASKLNWLVQHPQYDPVGSKFVFKADLNPELHLFRLWKQPGIIACSQTLRDALVAAKLTGVAFTKF